MKVDHEFVEAEDGSEKFVITLSDFQLKFPECPAGTCFKEHYVSQAVIVVINGEQYKLVLR